jgi:hypothetical protein
MRILAVLAVVAMMALVSPLANASTSFQAQLPGRVPLVTGPAFLPSNPLLQSAAEYTIAMVPGDRIVAHLAWDTASGPTGDDLDLTLLKPSGAPIPLPIPPGVGDVQALLASREARETCSDTAASSHNHQATGGPATEDIDLTVPSDGESGAYTLLVRGWVITTAGPLYTLDLTVLHDGADTSGSVAPGVVTEFITTAPNCELP